MAKTIYLRVTAACLGVVMTLATIDLTQAAPIRMQGVSTIAPDSLITDVRVRHRRHYRHYYRHHRRYNAAIPGAVLGLFGAALGAAVANDRYEEYPGYSDGYGYDQGYGYGYNPGYVYAQPSFGGPGGYIGGGHRGYGGHFGRGPRGGGGRAFVSGAHHGHGH